MTFIGYKQTNKQTNRQTDKPNLYIDWVKEFFKRFSQFPPSLRTHEISVLTFGETKLHYRGFIHAAEKNFEERVEGRTKTKKGDGTVVMKRKYVPTLARGSKIKGKYVPTLAMGSKMKGKNVPTLAMGSKMKGKYVPTLAMGSKMKGKLQI